MSLLWEAISCARLSRLSLCQCVCWWLASCLRWCLSSNHHPWCVVAVVMASGSTWPRWRRRCITWPAINSHHMSASLNASLTYVFTSFCLSWLFTFTQRRVSERERYTSKIVHSHSVAVHWSSVKSAGDQWWCLSWCMTYEIFLWWWIVCLLFIDSYWFIHHAICFVCWRRSFLQGNCQ